MRFYSPARRPDNERERQRAVDHSGFLDAAGDPELEAIIREAAALFGAPMAAISIVDRERQYFPVQIGIGADQTPRGPSFCAHAILTPDQGFCVPDADEDKRFSGNPLVLGGPEIRFYAGSTLIDEDGQALGALCVLDREAGVRPTPEQEQALRALADRAVKRATALRAAE
jgi:GAF domain-containing protein